MVGQTISHYKILEKLGEGGMGVVYKAEDNKLHRPVALKFLPPHLTRDQGAIERFVTEARAASALDHPNICTIYEINETNDRQMFISMAYYSGQILRDKVAEKQMPVAEAVNIVTQIATGLAKAHERNIVHRDIKPGNIIVQDDGSVKIIDFGISKLVGVTKLTKTGQTLGTLSYMSPEQLENKSVDHRSDIWSLGVIMYELLARELPFRGEYEMGMMYSILNEEPEPIESLRADVSANLSMCIQKMLCKDVQRRYQNMNELLSELKSCTAPEVRDDFRVTKRRWRIKRNYLTSGILFLIVLLSILAILFWNKFAEDIFGTRDSPQLVRIAVLPFDNVSPDPNDDYLADGMTDEMISKLSKIRDFRVIARTSIMRYKETLKNVTEIADELDVGILLEGSVRKIGSSLRISVQLVDVETQTPIWSNEYSRALDDVFAIQNDVSLSIVRALEVKLDSAEKEKMVAQPIENIHAYESYIRARQAIAAFDVDGMQRAFRDVQNALKVVGDNELLYSTMGWLHVHLVEAGFQTTEDYYQKAEEFVDKILDLNPGSFYGYALRGKIYNGRGNTQKAVRNLKRAYSIDPNNTDVLLQLSYNYIKSGNSAQAKPLLEKLMTIDPLTPLNYNIRGLLELMEGRFELGLEYFSEGYEMDPESPGLRLFYAWFLAANNCTDEACSTVDLLARDSPQTVLADLGLFLKHALRSEKEKALQSVTPALIAVATKVEYLSRLMADCFALVNEKERAMDWLENSINLGFIHYPYIDKYNPFLENIRNEERFKQLLEKVKDRWEHFEV